MIIREWKTSRTNRITDYSPPDSTNLQLQVGPGISYDQHVTRKERIGLDLGQGIFKPLGTLYTYSINDEVVDEYVEYDDDP